jgi:hypothetical protein
LIGGLHEERRGKKRKEEERRGGKMKEDCKQC